MKVLVSDNLERSCMEILEQEGLAVDYKPGLSAEALEEIISGYDGLVVRSSTQVNARVIARAASLKVIGRAGTGVDNIDVAAATRQGILVMNTPGGNTVSAAEHTVSMLLSLARNIPQACMSLREGKWERKKFTGTEVFEKTLGIVGLGKIGREVASRCQGLGMNVIGYDPILAQDIAVKLRIELVSLDELCRRSDFISLHTPLTKDTKALFGDELLRKCRKGVRIVNCARGGIVDEAALLKALEAGHVAGAALDVFEMEPPGASSLLLHEKVVSTPHLGASTEEAQEKVAIQIAHQLADALYGRGYVGLVNGSALQLTTNQALAPYVNLAERMGSFVAQISSEHLRNITLMVSGDLVAGSLELLKAGFLKGMLTHLLPEPVNYVNAPVLAAEMGVEIREQLESDGGDFPNLVRVRFESRSGTRELAGTVFGKEALRLVRLDSYRFEIRPEGYLLIYNNIDRPGMLARIGTVLAQHNVNIGGVVLGRSGKGAEALTVMNIDSGVENLVLQELSTLEGVSNLRLVHLEEKPVDMK